ncbi:uncharacterized protein LOC124837780 isoform X2 [Vigna umbellata]|nr:uncharacterized protein LOC124837780 isoform X2 [Vigna umbellata]
MGSQPKPKPNKALQQPAAQPLPSASEHHGTCRRSRTWASALQRGGRGNADGAARGGFDVAVLGDYRGVAVGAYVSGGGRRELASEEGDAAEGERGGERGTVGVLFGGGGGEEGDMEEVTSYCMATTTSFGLLSLKLDHQGILNAWSDKGSLYVAGDGGPHIVPDFLNGFLLHNAFLPHVAWDGWGNGVVGNTWNVTEDCGGNKTNVKEENGWKLGQREASVQRYKEKRQSRLFSKKIRYEVRKLNAEKRPRMK